MYLHVSEIDSCALLSELLGCLRYRVTKASIGKCMSFKCTLVRNDGFVGDLLTCFGSERVCPGIPRLLSLQILGKAIEGTILHVDKRY